MASMEAYFGNPETLAQDEDARVARLSAARQMLPNTPELAEKAYRRQLKPLFKEWLEIRFDFDQARGPYRKMMNTSSGQDLSDRTAKLKTYLENLENWALQGPNSGGDHILKQFTVWLKKQVDATAAAIAKAMGMETGEQVQSPRRQRQSRVPTTPTSSPLTPQLSPFSSPSHSNSNSPNSNSSP